MSNESSGYNGALDFLYSDYVRDNSGAYHRVDVTYYVVFLNGKPTNFQLRRWSGGYPGWTPTGFSGGMAVEYKGVSDPSVKVKLSGYCSWTIVGGECKFYHNGVITAYDPLYHKIPIGVRAGEYITLGENGEVIGEPSDSFSVSYVKSVSLS